MYRYSNGQIIMVPKNQSTPFTNNRERGIIKQKEQKNHDTKDVHTEYKTKLVLEVVREESRLEEIAAANEINPNMLRNWKQEFLKNASSVFSQKESKAAKRAEQKKEAALEKEKTKMLKKIGQLTLERDFLQDCFRACDLPIPEYDKSEG